jgi:hypothetical protein
MKNSPNYKLNVIVLVLSLSPVLGFSQCTKEPPEIQLPQEEKKKIIKIQCIINGKIAPPNLALGRKDIDLTLKTFPFYEQDRKEHKELVVKEFDVSLLRDGKKVANQVIFGNGSIAFLASMAKNEDTYLIQVREVFEKTKEGDLKPYAKGVIKLAYLFYDLDVFKPVGNAISAVEVK